MRIPRPRQDAPNGLVPDSLTSDGRRDPQRDQLDRAIVTGREGTHHADRISVERQHQVQCDILETAPPSRFGVKAPLHSASVEPNAYGASASAASRSSRQSRQSSALTTATSTTPSCSPAGQETDRFTVPQRDPAAAQDSHRVACAAGIVAVDRAVLSGWRQVSGWSGLSRHLPAGAALLVVWGLVTPDIVAWWLLPVIVVGSVGASIWRLERRS